MITWENATKILTVSGGTESAPISFATNTQLANIGVSTADVSASANGGFVQFKGNVTLIIEGHVTAGTSLSNPTVWHFEDASQVVLMPNASLKEPAGRASGNGISINAVNRTTRLNLSCFISEPVSSSVNVAANASMVGI